MVLRLIIGALLITFLGTHINKKTLHCKTDIFIIIVFLYIKIKVYVSAFAIVYIIIYNYLQSSSDNGHKIKIFFVYYIT